MSNTSDQTTQQSKTRLIVGEIGVDTETGIIGKGHSYDNGKTFVVDDTIYGRIYHQGDHDQIWNGIQEKVKKVVEPAKSAADSAQSAADAAVASAQVTSATVSAIASATAEAKQGANEAMSRAKSAWDVATGAKEAVTDFDPLLKSAQSDASNALTQIANTASALSDAKITFGSDVAAANELANTAQATAKDASGQTVSAVTTANGAMTAAKNAQSDVTVAIQTASGASLVATNAQSDATIAKQSASEATVQASNAESDFAQLSIRANKIEANVANNSGAIASVQQTANGLTTTVADIKANGGGVNLAHNTSNAYVIPGDTGGSKNIGSLSNAEWVALAGETITIGVTVEWTNWQASGKNRIGFEVAPAKNGKGYWDNAFSLWCNPVNGSSGKQRLTVTRTLNSDMDGVVGGFAYVQGGCDTAKISKLMIERGSVAHDYSPAPDDLQSQFTQIEDSIDGVKTTINDPKTGLNATYQTAAGNATTISNVKSDVYQLETTATGLTSRVGNLESKTNTQETEIQQNKNAIALKAEQTDVDTLKGNVTDLQATITTQANEIKAKVTQSDVTGMLTDYATQEYTQSLVTQKANDWNLNLTKLQTDVNAIKTTGGGVNLANGTSSEDQSYGDASQTTGWRTPTIGTFDNPQAGQQYTISVNTKTNGGSWRIQIWDGTSPTQRGKEVYGEPPIVAQEQKHSVTITWPSGSNKYMLVQLVNNNDGGQIVWNSAMIEEGAVAHTYSPAPSDMATVTSVTNLSATVDGIKSTVATKADQSTVTELSNLIQTKVSSSDYTSKISQLSNDINLRVKSADLISQINLQAGTALIQSDKLVMDANTTIFTGDTFIPDAAISEINTDKLYFSDSNGNKSFMSTNLGALDPMAPANSLSIRYKTGYEVTTSDRGVFFMMGQDYTRYAVKSKYSDKFSGIWASNTEAFFIEEGQGLHLWAVDKGQSAWALYNSNNVGIRASLANANAIDVGKVDDGYAYNTKMDTSPTAMAFYVNGWEWVAGYVEAMGFTQHSTLSSKTRIEEADPDNMLDLINNTELTTFAYKSELADGTDYRHIGPIIDDVNDVAQYRTPVEFVAPTKTARDDGNIVGALIGAVQALTKRIKILEEKTK